MPEVQEGEANQWDGKAVPPVRTQSAAGPLLVVGGTVESAPERVGVGEMLRVHLERLLDGRALSKDEMEHVRLTSELVAKEARIQEENLILSQIVRRVELLEKAVAGLSNYTAEIGKRRAEVGSRRMG